MDLHFLVMLLTFVLILIDVSVCLHLHYLTCEKNGVIEMQHNNNCHYTHIKIIICMCPVESGIKQLN